MKRTGQIAGKTKVGWTFFSNHGHVLLCLYAQPEQSLRDIASQVGITERAVHRILSDLESEGYLTRGREGRRNRYTFELDKKLRHPIEAHVKIRSLLKLV